MFFFPRKDQTIKNLILGTSLATIMPFTYAVEVNVDCNTEDLRSKIGAAAPGDVLLISGACYTNGLPFFIDKSLTLKNNDQNLSTPAILDGGYATGSGFKSTVIIIRASNVAIIGMTVKNGVNGITVSSISPLDNIFIKNSKIQNSVIGVVNTVNNKVTIEESLISNNNEGGILNSGELLVKKSTIANNTNPFNTPGLQNNSGIVVIEQSTITGNNTLGANPSGSAIYNNNGTLKISQSTISKNLVMQGGIVTTNNAVTLDNSIVAYNYPSDIIGFIPTNNNVFSSMNPNLGDLADNGGPTPTMKLLSDENTKMNCSNSPFTTDQRGAPRPGVLGTGVKASSDCNMGAYETGDALLVATPNTIDYGSVELGSASVAAPFVIANHGNDVAIGLSSNVTGPFTITMPLSVASLQILNSTGVSVTFNPTVAGAANGNFNITYNNAGASPLAVLLKGTGTSVVIPPYAQIQFIIDTFHQGIKNNAIYGIGKNKLLAKLRLIAFEALLQLSDAAIKKNKFPATCALMQTAIKLSDGKNIPPDFITGSGVAALNNLIVNLRTSLNCGPIRAEKSDNDKDNDAGNVRDR